MPSPAGPPEAVRESLLREGVVLPRLKECSVGWIDSPSAMAARLVGLGFSVEEIRQSRLLADRRLAGRFVGPIENAQGEIISFWARATADERPGYLYWRPDWKTCVPVVWLPTALARNGRKRGLLVVEDILEAVMLQTHGFGRTVALGETGQPISAKHWQQFARLRIARLILVLSQTQDAENRLQKAIAAWSPTAAKVRLWILPPKELGRWPSPGCFVREEGAEAFRNLLASKVAPATVFAQPVERNGRKGNLCPLHHCPETECFCFD